MTSPRFLPLALLVVSCVAATGCTQDVDESRLTTALPTDGYLAFRAYHPHANGRPGVLVEMRSPPAGVYALVYTKQPPSEVGWFQLDPEAFTHCTSHERATSGTELGCVLPGGREVADVVVVDGPSIIPPGEPRKPAQSVFLRHATCACTTCGCGERAATSYEDGYAYAPPWTGYYGLLRITPGNEPVDVTIEGLSLEDEADASSMTIERL